MVYQRGRKFIFLLEQEKFAVEHEIPWSSTKCLCSSTNFVLYHDLVRARARNFLLGHDIFCARARIFCARARTRLCPSRTFRARAQTRSCSSTKLVLEHKIFVLEHKNKVSTPLVHHISVRMDRPNFVRDLKIIRLVLVKFRVAFSNVLSVH